MYLAGTEATVVLGIIDHTELSWCHTVYLLLCMHDEAALARRFQDAWQITWGMTYLERYLRHVHWHRKPMEIINSKILFVGRFWVIAVRDIENVLLNVFLHDKPGATAEAHALALTDGMEPEPTVLSDSATCLQFDHVARLLTQIAADIVVVVDLA